MCRQTPKGGDLVENPNQSLRLFYQSLHHLSTENGGNFG